MKKHHHVQPASFYETNEYAPETPAYNSGYSDGKKAGIEYQKTKTLVEITRIKEQRDELLEALQKAVNRQGFSNDELISARAAIAKATVQ